MALKRKAAVKMPSPQDFAGTLRARKLIAERVARRGAREGSPQSTNVRKVVERAWGRLQGVQGINTRALIAALQEAERLEVDAILRDTAIIETMQRSQAEWSRIRGALGTIITYVNRHRRAKANRRRRRPSPADEREGRMQRRHIESIKREQPPGRG